MNNIVSEGSWEDGKHLSFWQPLESALDEIGELLADSDPFPRQLRELDEEDGGLAARFLIGLTQFFDTLQFGTVAFSLMLAREGWYPGGNLPLGILSEAATLLSNGDEDGNRMLATYFRAELGSLGEKLRASHPERAEAIGQTIQAHSLGYYWLSVPGFLILAEAIARDHRLPSPYGKVGTEKGIKDALLSRDDLQAAIAFMAPLLVSVPIDWSPSQRKRYGSPVLNRHLILHGESNDYGTEMNSLRALSHLVYVSDILRGFPLP